MNSVESKPWWQNASIYQIYPRSFRDSNDDGEGDIAGIILELPYIKSLGVDAIWLTPFYCSPNYDGGYDISDPRSVDLKFGTLADIDNLITETHKLGLKIIFDIVPNHFSTEHEWFKAALNNLPGSTERSRFHFYDGKGTNGERPPNNWNSLFGGPAWTRIVEMDGNPGQWYLHLFDSTQADLNWESLDVHIDFETTLRFWLDKEVDGFRVDVAHGLIKGDIGLDHENPSMLSKVLRIDSKDISLEERVKWLSDIPFFDQVGVHEIFRSWRKILDSYSGDRMSVAEVFVYPSSKLSHYVRADELNQVFNFDFLLIEWDSIKIREAITRIIGELGEVGALPTWALCNHDSIRVVTRLRSWQKARALALLIHALPGAVYIYQGEELGLIDGELDDGSRQDPIYFRSGGLDLGRDGCRVPIPWKVNDVNFGFSTGKPWLPQMKEYGRFAIDIQNKDTSSFLNFYRKTLELRRNLLAIEKNAEVTWMSVPVGVIFLSRNPKFNVVCNTNSFLINIKIGDGWRIIHESITGNVIRNGELTMSAISTVWLSR